MNTPKQLSDSLIAACKAAGIKEPRFIAQDEDGTVWHYDGEPDTTATSDIGIFAFDADIGEHAIKLDHPPYADDWQDSLMEWVEPCINYIEDKSICDSYGEPKGQCLNCGAKDYEHKQGEPLADVLARHGDLIGDDTEMLILYHIADTSKKIDDACKVAYQKHLEKGDGLCWSRLDCYRAAWQDALAWQKGGDQ